MKKIVVNGQKFIFKDVKGYKKHQHFAPLLKDFGRDGENVVVYTRANNTYCFVIREDCVIFIKTLLYHYHNEPDNVCFNVTRSMFDRFCTIES